MSVDTYALDLSKDDSFNKHFFVNRLPILRCESEDGSIDIALRVLGSGDCLIDRKLDFEGWKNVGQSLGSRACLCHLMARIDLSTWLDDRADKLCANLVLGGGVFCDVSAFEVSNF